MKRLLEHRGKSLAGDDLQSSPFNWGFVIPTTLFLIIQDKKSWLKLYWCNLLERITDPELRGVDCPESSGTPATLNNIGLYPK